MRFVIYQIKYTNQSGNFLAQNGRYRGSNTGVHVLLILLREFGKRDKMLGLSILFIT